MILFKKAKDLRNWLEIQQQNGKKIGFVPTMGALHAGHFSLVRESIAENDICVCSLFVNPTQFNDPKDFERYPQTIEADIDQLEASGCQVVFMPGVDEMYPEGLDHSKNRHYELGFLETVLEGKFRPGHYQGVCMIVHKLLEIVRPDRLYLGQKDFQQCLVIRRLLEFAGFAGKTEIWICPTQREKNGLAMSSRNLRLGEKELNTASAIFRTLNWFREHVKPGNTADLLSRATLQLESAGLRTEYLELANAETLREIHDWDGKEPAVLLAAAWLGDVRLIDNIVLNPV
jgi:pantoate--beta-alanine ligase